jgi:hypothetical protein
MPRSVPIHRHRWVPRVEQLEARCLLRCTITEVSGGLLQIQGDAGSNFVTIDDNGTGTAHNIQVTCENITQFVSVTAINQIEIATLGGADSVVYRLDSDTAAPLALQAFLGAGADMFTAELGGHQLLMGANLTFDIHGGPGRDAIDFAAAEGLDIQTGALLSIAATGDADRNRLTMSYHGRMDGTLNLDLSGGPDRDTIRVELAFERGSMGNLGDPNGGPATVSGNGGRDNLVFLIRDRGNVQGDALVDGGGDRDRCLHTDTVMVLNCEIDRPVARQRSVP